MRQPTSTRFAALAVAALLAAGVFAALPTRGDARAKPPVRLALRGRGLEADQVASTRMVLDSLDAPKEPAPALVPTPVPTERAERAPGHVAASRGAKVRTGAPLVWPANGALTGWFGEDRPGHMHVGIDIDGNTGDPVWAAAAGRVVQAGPAPAGYDGYGLIVVIDHGGGQTIYAHLSRIDVAVGDVVDARTGLGAIGTSGHVTGSHLHFELRVNDTAVDPMPYLPAR